MMDENPLHAPHANASDSQYIAMEDQVTENTPLRTQLFSEEEWMRLQEAEAYFPLLNGQLHRDYLELRVKMQTELGILVDLEEDGKFNKRIVERSFVEIPAHVQEARIDRVLQADSTCLRESRDKYSHVTDEETDKIITSYGEEIIYKLKCVALLNSPDTHDDYKGDGYIYLTKRLVEDKIFHRIYFYCHGETAKYHAEEVSESVDKQWIEFFENLAVINTRTSYGFKSEFEHIARRDVTGQFLSVDLEDVMQIFHRISDYTEMKRFAKNEKLEENEVRFIDARCCQDLYLGCQDCLRVTCVCCPKEFFNQKIWKWMMNASNDNDLSDLVCKEETRLERQKNVRIYDPYLKQDIIGESLVTTKLSKRRFHTLNLSCADGYHAKKKYRAVIVLSPEEPVTKAIQFICLVNKIMDSIKRDWFLNGTPHLTQRDAFKQFEEILPREKSFLHDLIFGGESFQINITDAYYYNTIVLIFLSFIGMIICFVAVATNSFFVVNGLYSLAHFGNRIYNVRVKKYVPSTLYKDVGVGFLGLILAGISVEGNSDGSTDAGAAFMFLQAFSSFFGAAYQLYKYWKTGGGENGNFFLEVKKKLFASNDAASFV